MDDLAPVAKLDAAALVAEVNAHAGIGLELLGPPRWRGQLDGTLDQRIACWLGQGMELDLRAGAELDAVAHRRGQALISCSAGTKSSGRPWRAASSLAWYPGSE